MVSGFVSLVGAGPGDPGLWTFRAARRIAEADIVFYDSLVDGDALRNQTRAQCFCVGKRAGGASVKQETINKLLIRAARRGKLVVRLKGGDPFVFGRGAEEAIALAEAGVPYEIVPGVTSAVAAAELAGIPVTHRGIASAFLVVSGHTGDQLDPALESVKPNSLTLIVMMGLTWRGDIASRLIAYGWQADTPSAIVCSASTARQWTWTGTLDALAAATPPEGLPGVLVIGDVVRVGDALAQATAGRNGGIDEVTYGRNR
jgi:uroporphyrin-III C-methyltransferase/precorrin-2 dehydrogenase/sirohydrochlorin ferrochelatase